MTEMHRSVIDRYFVALNDEDYEVLKEVFHPAAVLRPPGTRARTGHDEIMRFFLKVFKKFPQHVDTPSRVLSDGNCVTVEIDFTGVTSNQNSVAFAAVDIFDIENSQIINLSQWFDTVEVARQVGTG
ncbi:MAG: nuclear transport factor 2 family protein [Acidimicrobiales bacterium]|nr:nuclear transport factor 2 family protein [Longimicrobiales bacterium]MDE0873268.1 nuclear transport factor 2 family protein [Acidimicrobiales bacterium]